MKNLFVLLLLNIIVPKHSPVSTISGDDILGYWITEDNKAVVHCTKKNSVYEAHVVWYGSFKEENLEKMSDYDREHIKTKYLNAEVLKGFEFTGNQWSGGKIIQVFENKTYTAYIEKTSDKEMKITGFILFKWISESTIIRRCNKPDGTKAPKVI
jgi:uncharacterized protein (DUF2147 family)